VLPRRGLAARRVLLRAGDCKADRAAEFLDGDDEFIQGDGYAGYARALGPAGQEKPLVAEERRLGCGMHIRRKF
jgi:hypothetical protein